MAPCQWWVLKHYENSVNRSGLPVFLCPFSKLSFSACALQLKLKMQFCFQGQVQPSERICMRFTKPSPPLKSVSCACQVSRSVGQSVKQSSSWLGKVRLHCLSGNRKPDNQQSSAVFHLFIVIPLVLHYQRSHSHDWSLTKTEWLILWIDKD